MNYEQLKALKISLEKEIHDADLDVSNLELEERTPEINDQINLLKEKSYNAQREWVQVNSQMKKLKR